MTPRPRRDQEHCPRTPIPVTRVVALLLGLSSIASAFMWSSTAQPAMADGRALTVTPAANLGNEVVRVSWSGFRPTYPDGTYGVQLYQCKANPQRLADCNTAEAFPAAAEGNKLIGFTSEDGTGAIDFEVRPAAQLPELGCSLSSPCTVMAFENDPDDPPSDATLPASAVSAPLTFARSQADCPTVTDFDVRVDGSSSAAPLFYQWAAELCGGEDPLVVDYTDTSSTTGRENFLNGLVDMGVSALPPTEAELEEFPNHPDYIYAPVSLTAVAVVVNMLDLRTNLRIENLVLSPRLVSRLITNSDLSTFLSDPELRLLNPSVVFPTVFSKPLLRAERDSDSRAVTEWMATTPDAKSFLADRDRYGRRLNPSYIDYARNYPTDGFEVVDSSDDQYVPRTGQRNVALRTFYRVKPSGSTPETNLTGFIGIVDLPTAKRFALPVAKLVNASGNAVAPTPESILAGYEAMRPTAAGPLAPDFATRAAGAYPLVKVDYAWAATDAPAERLRNMARLLAHAAGPGQASLPDGFVPLPATLKAQTTAVAALLGNVADPPATTTTSTPSAPPTTTTTTTYSGYDSGSSSYGGSSSDDYPTDPAPTVTTSTSTPADAGPGTTTTTFAVTTSTIGPPGLPTPQVPAIPTALGLSGVGATAWGAAGLAQRRARMPKGKRTP